MPPICRRSNLQNLAKRLDPEGVAVLVDESLYDFSRRRGLASRAPPGRKTFNISLAPRSSLFSRSSSLIRCVSPVVMPSRAPASTSARLTHSFRVCGTQPILRAMDSMVAHSDGYSPRCSRTILPGRSRTSGENLFDLLVAQSSQSVEHLRKPGRFSSLLTGRRAMRALSITTLTDPLGQWC